MNTKLLQQFSMVAHAGSITEASKRLHIAQPALSHAIGNLEEEVGVKLFERHRRGVRLTEPGTVLLEHAHTILRQIEYARSAVREVSENPSGPVSVALPASVTHVIARPLCEAVLSGLPNVTLSLDEGLTGNLNRFLRSGRIDLMVDFDVDSDDEFELEPLIREDLYLFGKDLGSDDDITLVKASDYPVFLPATQHAMGRAVDRYQQASGTEIKRFPIQLGVHPMLSLVQAGVGHTILPWSLIHDLVGQSGLRARRIIEPDMSRTAYLISMRSQIQSPATKAVAAIVRQAVETAHRSGLWRGELLI